MVFFWGLGWFFWETWKMIIFGGLWRCLWQQKDFLPSPASLPRLHWLGSIETRLPFSFIPCSRYYTCLYLPTYLYVHIGQCRPDYRFSTVEVYQNEQRESAKEWATNKLRIYRECKNMLCNGIRHTCGVMRHKIVLQSNSTWKNIDAKQHVLPCIAMQCMVFSR